MEAKNKEDKTHSSQDNDTLNDLEERLARLESDIKLIKEQIERIGVILLND